MTRRKTLQTLALLGAGLSAAVAFVIYRINAGSGNDTPGQCLFWYVSLSILGFFYYFVCVSRCRRDERESECVVDCFLYLIIIQLVLIIGLLACVIASGF